MESPAVIALPMHGERKLLREGFRTRDGHLIEWFSKVGPSPCDIHVVSRPEPVYLPRSIKQTQEPTSPRIRFHSPRTTRVPSLKDRRKWWVDSLRDYSLPGGLNDGAPAVLWNPFVSTSAIGSKVFNGTRHTHADLLDDWLVHHAFESVRPQVSDAYRTLFDQVDTITANSEGTMELASSFGRHDAMLIPNGVDPERFTQESHASGPTRVGYIGKIGRRVDLDLVVSTARRLLDVEFVLAGPILDHEYRRPLSRVPNIQLMGDVHYAEIPALLATFDVGWVPHRVGSGEVGGDAIKIYEYRAAGLPVLTTPIIGASNRNLAGVTVLEAPRHGDEILRLIGRGSRVARVAGLIDRIHTWEHKANTIMDQIFRR